MDAPQADDGRMSGGLGHGREPETERGLMRSAGPEWFISGNECVEFAAFVLLVVHFSFQTETISGRCREFAAAEAELPKTIVRIPKPQLGNEEPVAVSAICKARRSPQWHSVVTVFLPPAS